MLILLRSIHCSTYGVADFLLFYPKVTIKELDSVIEDGMFVATITGFLEGEDWWFPYITGKRVDIDALSLIGEQNVAGYKLHIISR